MDTPGRTKVSYLSKLGADEWADWSRVEDFRQDSIDNAATALVMMEGSGEWYPLRQDEIRAVLCAISTYSTVASKHLEGDR